MEQKKVTEQDFREALLDAAVIIAKLAPLCGSFEELTGMIGSAADNPAVLKLLMREVYQPPGRAR